jgi:PAS domain S-box-containing protein
VAALFLAGGFAVRLSVENPTDGVQVLYVLPIALVALEWGVIAGLVTAAASLGLFAAWVEIDDVEVEAIAYFSRAGAFFPIALIVGIGADRLRESRYRESRFEDRQREILETANEAFIAVDRDGSITAWNPAAERLFGWQSEEAIGRPLSETVVPPRMREGFWRGLRHFFQTGEGPMLGERVEIEAVRRDGEEIPIELSLSAARAEDDWTFHGFIHDISERKESERRLEEAARYFELSHDLVCTATLDGRFDQLNGRWQAALGWTPDELRSRPFVEFVHPDDREATARETRRLGEGGESAETVAFRNRYRAKDGSWHWLEWTSVAVPGEQRIYAAARDVTERVDVELANERLGAIVEFSDDAIYGYTLDGEITSWNPAAERLYGYTHQEAIGMSLQQLVPPDRPDDTPALIASTARGEPVKDAESLRLAKDGSRVEVSLRSPRFATPPPKSSAPLRSRATSRSPTAPGDTSEHSTRRLRFSPRRPMSPLSAVGSSRSWRTAGIGPVRSTGAGRRAPISCAARRRGRHPRFAVRCSPPVRATPGSRLPTRMEMGR